MDMIVVLVMFLGIGVIGVICFSGLDVIWIVNSVFYGKDLE